jgi:hypothetical protein
MVITANYEIKKALGVEHLDLERWNLVNGFPISLS